MRAWEALPANLRTDIFKLETTSRHLTNTGKTPAQISSEISTSGSYNKWLADHSVEFVKDGHRIDAPTLSSGYEHIDNVVLNGAGKPTYSSTSGIVGAHNIDNFMAQTVSNGGRVEIVTNVSTSVTGVNKIQYKVLALDGQGNPIPGQYFSNGAVFTKTTFNPSVHPPDIMKRNGYEGYHNAIETGNFGPARSFNGMTRDGLPIAGHYKTLDGSNVVSTWWIDAN